MAPRPYWKGYLKLSLVSCAVALYSASSRADRIAFHWLNRKTGHRLRQQMVDSETLEPVEREDRVHGYEVAKNQYVQVEDEEIEKVQIESSHTIDIEKFIPKEEVDPVYFDNSYYLVPSDKVSEEAFAVIRKAMEREGVVGLGRVVIARRERVVLLEPRGKGMLAAVLHFKSEVRSDEAYFADIADVKVPEEMVDLAKHIISSKEGHFETTAMEDRYENALIELIKAKQAGKTFAVPEPKAPPKVVNLMDALKKSIEASAGEQKSPLAQASPRREGRRERGRKPHERPSPPRKVAG